MRSTEAQPVLVRSGWSGRALRWLVPSTLWLRAAWGWQAPLLPIAAAALLLGAYQVERPYAVNVGGAHETPFTQNFHPKETADDGQTSMRWTHQTSFLLLKGVGGGRERLVTLRLRSGRPAGVRQPVTILVNGVELQQIVVGPEWQTVRLDVQGAAAAAHGVSVELRTNAEKLPTSGGKVVGVQVDRLRVETAGAGRTVPAWDTFGLTLAAVLLVYLIAVRVLSFTMAAAGRRRWTAALAALAGALVLAALFALARPYIAAYSATLCGLLLGILAVLLLPAPLMWLGSRLGLAVTRPEAVALCAILALGIAVKLGGLLYPDTNVIDLPWHVKWQRTLLQGDFAALYFPSALSSGPGEWGEGIRIPKSPLYYVAMAPVTLLPVTVGVALKLAAGLIESTMLLFAYAFLKRLGHGTAGVAAAALYTVTPLSYLVLSFGSYPTLFAQFLTTAAFATLLGGWRRFDHPAVFAAFTALLTLSLLAYPVVAVFNVCVLTAFGLWRWRDAHDAGETRRALLVLLGVALAALLAFLGYYIHHVGVTLASVGTLTGETAQSRGRTSGGLLTAPGHILSVAVKSVLTGRMLVLLVIATAGVILWRRETREDVTRVSWQLFLLWFLIMPAFVPVDAYVELLLKPLFYTMLPVAVFGGVTLVWLWRRGRTGRIVAVLCYATIAAQAWWLWFQRVAYAGQPAG